MLDLLQGVVHSSLGYHDHEPRGRPQPQGSAQVQSVAAEWLLVEEDLLKEASSRREDSEIQSVEVCAAMSAVLLWLSWCTVVLFACIACCTS